MNLDIIGRTQDGLPVVDIFQWYDTEGMPLDDCITIAKANGMMPAWHRFYDQAVAAGWNRWKLVRTLHSAVQDNYDADFCALWRWRMLAYVKHREAGGAPMN